MSENKWHKEMDDWLKDSMDELPNPKVSDWEAFEVNRQQTNKKKGLLWFSSALAVILLFSLFGDYNFNQKVNPAKTETIKNQSHETAVAPEGNENINLKIKPSTNANNSKANSKTPPLLKPVTQKWVAQNKVKNSRTNTQATFNNHVKTAILQEPAVQDWAASPFAVNYDNVVFDEIPSIETIDEKNVLVRQTSFGLSAESYDSVANTYAVADVEPEEGLFEDEKFSVTIGVYPNYTFRDLKIRGSDENKVHKEYMGIINSSEKGGMAFNVGAELKYKIGQDLFLGSGINYIQTKITGTFDFEITEDPIIDPSTQNIIGYSPAPEGTFVNTGILNSYSYLQIPLVLSYQPWINKKLRMVVEGGTSYLRFLNAEGTTIDYQNLRPIDLHYLDYNKNLFTVNFKIGVNYYLNPQFALGVEPTFMYFSNSIYADDYPIYMVPWSIGVNFNLKIRLR